MYLSQVFQNQLTSVPCQFVFDEGECVMYLQTCPTLAEQQGFQQGGKEMTATEQYCKEIGGHQCDTLADADRYIQQRWPELWETGVGF